MNDDTFLLIGKRSILLAAFGFAVTMSTHTCTVRRTRAATRMHFQKPPLMVLEISFSVVRLLVMLIYFIRAELGVKNNFNTSFFPLIFAIYNCCCVYFQCYLTQISLLSFSAKALKMLIDGFVSNVSLAYFRSLTI